MCPRSAWKSALEKFGLRESVLALFQIIEHLNFGISKFLDFLIQALLPNACSAEAVSLQEDFIFASIYHSKAFGEKNVTLLACQAQ